MSVQPVSGNMPVVLLKDDATQTKGRDAQKNNIAAAKIIADIVHTSLGPRGMDKMLVDSLGDVTITNDGATILKEIDVQHPAAKMLVEISKTTDNEVGDGTTSVVVLAGAMLESAESLLDQNVHPTVIVDGYKKAAKKARELLQEMANRVTPNDTESLTKIAKTAMQTKIVRKESDNLARIVVKAALAVAQQEENGFTLDVDEIKVDKKAGGSIKNSGIVRGVILDKEVVHSGMPKRVEEAKIILLNAAIEITKTETDAKINISDPNQLKAFLKEESNMIKNMTDKIIQSGANVVFCQKGVDDMAQHHLAKSDILVVRRVKESDLSKLSKSTGGRIVSNLQDLTAEDLGNAGLVEERKIEEDKWVFVQKCKDPKSVNILLRGGTQRVVDEVERSVHDAIMVVKDVMQTPLIVPGGGAPETFIAAKLRTWAKNFVGREQLAIEKYAESLESIPLALAGNAGMDPIDTLTALRSRQIAGETWTGINVLENTISNMEFGEVVEPLAVKNQILSSATEAACMLLRIDDIVTGSKSTAPPGGGGEGMGGMPPGMGGMGGMPPGMGGMM